MAKTDGTITPDNCLACFMERREYGVKYCTPHYLVSKDARRFDALGRPRG